MEWTNDNPGAGDLRGVDALAARLREAADGADWWASSLMTMCGVVAMSWRSPSAFGAWERQMEAQVSSVRLGAVVMRHLADRATRYAADVREIKAVVYPARDAMDDLAASADACRWLWMGSWSYAVRPRFALQEWVSADMFESDSGETFTAPRAPGGGWHGSPPTQVVDSMARAQAWADFFDDESAYHAGLIEAQRDVRRSADQAVASAMSDFVPSWADTKASFLEVGITDPAHMTSTYFAIALAEEMKASRAGLSWEEATRLSAFFDEHGQDSVLMSTFFTTLGGAGTATLTGAAGWMDYGLCRSIRDGLSVGSGDWTQEQADSFLASARSLSEREVREQSAAWGFLFNGPPYMGAAFSVAAANWAEEWEAKHGAWGVSRSAWTPEVNQRRHELKLPVWFDAPEERWQTAQWGDSQHTLIDVSGNIMRNLGQHPAEATAWLTTENGDVNTKRVKYWIEERDWDMWGDGGRAPITLLAATQDPSLHPSIEGAADDPAWQTSAKLFASIVTGIMDNESMTIPNADTGNKVSVDLSMLHPDAVTTLAQVMANSYPQLNALWDSDRGVPAKPGEEVVPDFFVGELPYGAGRIPVPVMDVDDWEDLLGASGATPAGRDTLDEGFRAYRAAVIEAAKSSEQSADTQVDNVIEQLAATSGRIEHAVDTAVMDQAAAADRLKDQEQANTRAQVVTVAGIATAPFAPGGMYAVVFGTAVAEVQAVADLGLSFLDNPCTDNVDASHDERQVDAAADYERNRSSFVHAAVDLYGTDELRIPPEPDPSYYDMADPGQRSRLAADRRVWLNRAEAAVNGHYRASTHDTDWSIRKIVNDLNSGRRVG